MLCVLPGTLAEDEVSPIIQSVQTILTEAGVGNIKVQDNGKNRLAYPIKHIRYGYQFIFHFEAEPENIPEAQQKLGLSRDLLRNLITIYDPEKRAVASSAIARAQVRQDQNKKKQAQVARSSEDKRYTPAKEKREENEETKTVEAPVATTDSVEESNKKESIVTTITEEPKELDIEKLDKELDDILDNAFEDV